jgi:hypothetical protein
MVKQLKMLKTSVKFLYWFGVMLHNNFTEDFNIFNCFTVL